MPSLWIPVGTQLRPSSVAIPPSRRRETPPGRTDRSDSTPLSCRRGIPVDRQRIDVWNA